MRCSISWGSAPGYGTVTDTIGKSTLGFRSQGMRDNPTRPMMIRPRMNIEIVTRRLIANCVSHIEPRGSFVQEWMGKKSPLRL